MSRPRVLVASPLVGEHVAALSTVAAIDQAASPLERAALLDRIVGAAALIATPAHRVDSELLDRAASSGAHLRLVSNHAVGVDNVDLEACRKRSVIVTNTPGVLTEATADLAFGLIIDACRRISEGDRLVRAGGWTGWAPTAHLGRRVNGATLGIVGFGRIGRAVAKRARAFDMRIVCASRSEVSGETHGAKRMELDEMLAISDVVTIHAPLDAMTAGLFSRARLLRMKRGAFLINTSRGGLVDERALAELLAFGHLGGAGLDVYASEPQVDPALLSAPHVVLAPHIGSADVETRDAMAGLACAAVRDVFEGRAPRFRVV